MIVSDNLIKELKENYNITIRFYPCSDEDYYKQRYEYRYKWLEPYFINVSHFVGDKLVTENLPDSDRCEKAEYYAKKDIKNWYDANKLYIRYYDKNNNEILFIKSENIKSKVITAQYIIDLVNKNRKTYNSYFGEFCIKMRQLLKENNLDTDCSVYPTTYGIGVWVFYNSKFDENQQKLTDILKNKGVIFENEFSDKQWVYRFKISKKRENLLKIV